MTVRLLIISLISLSSIISCTPPGGGNTLPPDSKENVPEGYELVWNDEFNEGPMPDTSKWGYQTGGYGWTAKEKQNYLEADPDNVNVSDGLLNITARVERVKTNNYTSTRLVSKNKGEFEYGYIEVRARMASGNGKRSAFWLVGANVSEDGWPYAGEIDLYEHYGQLPSVVNSAVQTPENHWLINKQLGSGQTIPDAETAFHTYGCLWTKDSLVFSIDGEAHWTYTPRPGKSTLGYPFVWPFYMAATLSVGGERGPNSKIDNAAFPATMSIDYVRVFQQQ